MRNFINYRLSWRIYWTGSGFSLIFLLIDLFAQTNWLGGIGAFLLLTTCGQLLFFYRCPNCGKRLPLKGGKNGAPVPSCPHCEYNLGWNFGGDEEA